MPEPQMPVTPVSAVAWAKPGSSDPIDPHALDRARRGALPGRDLGALECRSGRA
jgi:hypothetical protein